MELQCADAKDFKTWWQYLARHVKSRSGAHEEAAKAQSATRVDSKRGGDASLVGKRVVVQGTSREDLNGRVSHSEAER